MKYKITIIIIFSFFIFTFEVTGQNKEEQLLYGYNYLDKVKKVNHYMYFSKNDMTEKTLISKTTWKYDIYGSRLLVGNDMPKSGTFYSYDDKQNLISVKNYSKDTLTNLKNFIYDHSGILKESYSYKNEQLNTKTEFEYDVKGNLILKRAFIKPYRREIHFEYDEQNNLTKKETFTFIRDSITSSEKYLYKYDNIGNQIERIIYRSTNNHQSRQTSEYDKNSNKIESTSYYSNGKIRSKRIMKYDDYNQCTETIHYFGRDLKNPGKIETFEYEYDEKGNWTKMILSIKFYKEAAIDEKGAELYLHIEEKEIEYY